VKEQVITMIMNMVLILFFIVGLFGLTLFAVEVQNVNSFKQTVNYHIERNGGLSEAGVAQLNEHANQHFNSRFSVVGEFVEVSFGDVVTYQIKATIPVPFTPIPDVHMQFTGSAISKVR